MSWRDKRKTQVAKVPKVEPPTTTWELKSPKDPSSLLYWAYLPVEESNVKLLSV